MQPTDTPVQHCSDSFVWKNHLSSADLTACPVQAAGNRYTIFKYIKGLKSGTGSQYFLAQRIKGKNWYNSDFVDNKLHQYQVTPTNWNIKFWEPEVGPDYTTELVTILISVTLRCFIAFNGFIVRYRNCLLMALCLIELRVIE